MVFANPRRYLRDVFLMAVAFLMLGSLRHGYGWGTALELVINCLQGILIGAFLAATALSIRRAE